MLLPMLLVVVDSVASSLAEVENMDCCWGDTIDHPCPNAIHCPISLIHSKSKDNFSSYHDNQQAIIPCLSKHFIEANILFVELFIKNLTTFQ
jgi:hypothetical protein